MADTNSETRTESKLRRHSQTTVYQMKLSGDQMTLEEPGGSKLEFTKVKESQR